MQYNRYVHTFFYRPRQAFTLTELLVSIAIIGILAGILLPVINRVRTSARQTMCVSNLRQTHVGIMTYVADNKGWFPDVNDRRSGGTTWWLAVAPYMDFDDTSNAPVSKILQCPEVTILAGENYASIPNYGLNFQLGRRISSTEQESGTRRNISEVRDPAHVILAGDNGLDGNNAPQAMLSPRTAGGQGDKHPGGSNFVWIDGHVSTWKDVSLLNEEPWKVNGADDVWTP